MRLEFQTNESQSRVEGGVSGAQQLDFWCRLI
jgi:hypothetical protein